MLCSPLVLERPGLSHVKIQVRFVLSANPTGKFISHDPAGMFLLNYGKNPRTVHAAVYKTLNHFVTAFLYVFKTLSPQGSLFIHHRQEENYGKVEKQGLLASILVFPLSFSFIVR